VPLSPLASDERGQGVDVDRSRKGGRRVAQQEKEGGRQGGTKLNPGDVAPPGTPGTGEAICPACQGQGRIASGPCPECGGTGKIIAGIAGG
jgi:hypothetical protein